MVETVTLLFYIPLSTKPHINNFIGPLKLASLIRLLPVVVYRPHESMLAVGLCPTKESHESNVNAAYQSSTNEQNRTALLVCQEKNCTFNIIASSMIWLYSPVLTYLDTDTYIMPSNKFKLITRQLNSNLS